MLSTQEKNTIKRILQDPGWSVMRHCADTLISNIQDGFVVRDTEWETIKGAVTREAMIHGINKFIEELYNNAN